MKDGRAACIELCETSRLALCLARLGREAGLHHAPLFSVLGSEPTGPGSGTVRESDGRSWGTTPGLAASAKPAHSADDTTETGQISKARRAANKIR